MGVTNLDGSEDDTHVKQIAEFAMDLVEAAGQILIDDEDPSRGYIHVRVGYVMYCIVEYCVIVYLLGTGHFFLD